MAAITATKLADDAIYPAQWFAVLPNGEAGFAVEQRGCIQVAVVAGQVEGQFKRLGEGFAMGEVDDCGIIDPGQGHGKLQSRCVRHDVSLRLCALAISLMREKITPFL